jgi:hypothetical protein
MCHYFIVLVNITFTFESGTYWISCDTTPSNFTKLHFSIEVIFDTGFLLNIQVSNLIILNEAGVQDQHAFPDLVSSAEHIFQTVRTLTHTGNKLAQESSDEVNSISSFKTSVLCL